MAQTRSLFVRIFLGVFSSSLIILFILSLTLTFAIKTSIFSWNQGKQADLQSILIPVISKIHRLNGGLTESNVEMSLRPYLTDSLYVYVFDADKEAIFLFNQGTEVSVAAYAQDKSLISPQYNQLSLIPIVDGETTIAFLASDSIDFLAHKANRSFIETMKKTIIAGAILSLLISLLLSYMISNGFSRQTNELVKGIVSLSKGKRQESFPEMGIHELDQLARAATELQRKLSQEEGLRQQWMQDISHDLRTPITAVIAQFEAMIDGALDLNQDRIKGLMSEILRIEALVQNLQELSRYESPDTILHIQHVRLSDFADDIKERFAFLAAQQSIDLSCWGSNDIFPMDEQLMQRCISNIVQNALQHTQSGGRIELDANVQNERLRFRISNTGHIPEEDIDQIFDRLYRGQKARNSSGSGLGLSIAKAIVDLHRGSISVSQEGDMTVFTVSMTPQNPKEYAGDKSTFANFQPQRAIFPVGPAHR